MSIKEKSSYHEPMSLRIQENELEGNSREITPCIYKDDNMIDSGYRSNLHLDNFLFI